MVIDSPRAPAAVIELLWETLSDLMGSAATATLLRRAAKRATRQAPALAGFEIVRDVLEYHYRLPDSWKEAQGPELVNAMCELTRELRPLLVELTGAVVLRRLDTIPELAACCAPEAGDPQ